MKELSAVKWDHLVVHFNEIALKGGNRQPFIKKLHENLKRVLPGKEIAVQSRHDRLIVRPPQEAIVECLKAASRLFGVSHVAPFLKVQPTLDALCQAAVQTYTSLATDGDTFAIQAKRSDKKFPIRSHDLQVQIGQAVVNQTGSKVNLGNPDIELKIRISRGLAYLEGPRTSGPGGLPTGVTGNVLTLFSGGIDSPAAAWLMMRRGCTTNFVHFHVFRTGAEVMETKIPELVKSVIQPQGIKTRLYLVPYHPFQLELLNHDIPQNLELILFRRFMIRTADRLAEREKLHALVTGDNLAQVASQTLENLVALENVATRPVFRPLLTFDKREIVDLTKRIGTFEPSTGAYKDCCSLVAKHPQTKPSKFLVDETESGLPVEAMSQQALDETEFYVV